MLRFGLLVIPRLSRQVIIGIATLAGRAAYACARKQQRIALANLRIAFGSSMSEAELHAIAEKSFRSIALVILDFLWFSRDTSARLARWVTIDDSIRKGLAKPPVIGVTAHFGNWELISSASAELGVRHAAVFAGLKNPFVTPFLSRMRNADGVEVVRREGAIGKLLKALRKGNSIALLLDQNTVPGEGGVFVDFFGLPAPVSSAAGLLSERTGVPVLISFCMLRPDGSYFLYSLPALRPPHRPAKQEEPAAGVEDNRARLPTDSAVDITQAIVRAFETEITRHPEQWLWMYKRWKFFAPGVPREKYPFYSRSP